MNRTRIEEVGLKSLADIHTALGGWPCVVGDEWNKNETWNWPESTKSILNAGFGHSYLFVISIDTDMRNSSRRRIVVCFPILNESHKWKLIFFCFLSRSSMNQHWD